MTPEQLEKRQAELKSRASRRSRKRANFTPPAPEVKAPDYYSDERMAQRQEGKLLATPGVEVTKDQFTNDCQRLAVEKAKRIKDPYEGRKVEGNPHDEAIAPYREANPDKRFKFLSPTVIDQRGLRGWQKLYDPDTGKEVKAGKQSLHWMPEEIAKHEEKKLRDKVRMARKAAQEQFEGKAADINRQAAADGFSIPLLSTDELPNR